MNKPSKYKNVKTIVDSITFSSKKEAAYYGVLKMRKLAGEIASFSIQQRFPLVVNKMLCGNYIADFVTYGKQGEILEVIDVKGFKTPIYNLKKKLIEAIYGITIIEK